MFIERTSHTVSNHGLRFLGVIQVMGFGLFLMDGKEVNINKLDSRRKVNLAKVDKIFKVSETLHSVSICMLIGFSGTALYNL